MAVRLTEPHSFYSAGRWRTPQRYVVGWPEGIVKVGCTFNGKRRWGPFLVRGGEMLDLGYYDDDLAAEVELRGYLATLYAPAFSHKEQARAYLGNGGAGYLECYLVPVADWPLITERAKR